MRKKLIVISVALIAAGVGAILAIKSGHSESESGSGGGNAALFAGVITSWSAAITAIVARRRKRRGSCG